MRYRSRISTRNPSGFCPNPDAGASGPSAACRERLGSGAALVTLLVAAGLHPLPAAAQLAADATQEVRLDELAVSGAGENTMRGARGARLAVDGYLARQSVSATRTETPLRQIPQAVVVVPDQVLEDAAATRVDTALDLAGVGRANNFAGLGLTGADGRPLTAPTVRRTWWSVRRDVAAARARRAKPPHPPAAVPAPPPTATRAPPPPAPTAAPTSPASDGADALARLRAEIDERSGRKRHG